MIEREDISEKDLEEAVEHEGSEPRTLQIDDELMLRMEQVFSTRSTQDRSISLELAKIASEYSVIDLAFAALRLPLSQRHLIYDELEETQERSEFLVNVDSATRSLIFRGVDDKEVVEVVEHMPTDEAVWVLEDLIVPRYRRIMNLIDPKKAVAISELAKHDPNTAGRLMTNEFFAFRMDTTLGEAARYIKDNPSIDLLRRIFVLDEEGELQGFVPLRNLVINPPMWPLKKVMKQVVHIVDPQTSRDDVIEIFERYKNADLPVTDDAGRLVGVITYEDVAEAIEDQTDETFAHISGTSGQVTSFDPLMTNVISRAPWLIVTMIAGFMNATNISFFDLNKEVLTFVPLVIGMSGNVGIQCSTLIVRGMALGLITKSSMRKVMFREFMTCVVIGLVFGVLIGAFIYLLSGFGWQTQDVSVEDLVLIVSAGQIGACILSGGIGASSPVIFHRLGFDPAVASGPITTAINDVLATIIYFVIAVTLLNALT